MKRLSLSAAALAAAFACAPAAAQTVLTLSSWVPPTHALTIAQKEWCDLVAQKANGKIKCNQLPRGVAAPPGTIDAIKNGLADVSFTVHGYTPGRFVLTQMAEFPFLGDSAKPLSEDSTIRVRYRSSFGLKYLEIQRGDGEALPEGGSLALTQATEQVEFDDIANRTRGGSRLSGARTWPPTSIASTTSCSS